MKRLLSAAALAALCAGAPAAAAPLVLDADQGAVFDAIIDGFPMLAVYDGVPDFPTGYNTLSIGLQIPVTEERGIGEFPVAPLAGAAPEAVQSATLVFNIDDVIGTFGPGTSFRGEASRTILVHLYAGDGAVTIADYLAVARPAHAVDTTPHGRITDASLRQSGPLVFAVDVTDDVRTLLADAPPAIGVVWRTTDAGTATSLDHLGDGGGGPPGVSGAFLPYLEIDLAPPSTPTPTPTAPPSDTATPLATATAPPTATGVPGTPSASASVTPTRTPGVGPCAGDCDGDGSVRVSELIAGVTLALGTATTPCPAIDTDGDGLVSVAELIQAVNAALAGC